VDPFSHHILGQTEGELQIETSEDNRLAITCLTRQSSRTIDIISRRLDPGIYDTTDFIDAIRQFALKNHHSRVRILVYEPEKIARRGHRLINVAASLSSFFHIRTPGMEFKDFNESLFVADKTAYVHRLFSERYEASVNFNDKRMAHSLVNQFEEMWEKATPDSSLRRFHL